MNTRQFPRNGSNVDAYSPDNEARSAASLPIGSRAAERGLRPKLDYTPDDPLLNARECAVERRQGLSTFWRDVKLGRVSPGIRIGPRLRRWRRSEIRAGIDALSTSTK